MYANTDLPFIKWLVVNPGALPWTGADVVAAVNTLIQWVLAHAAILDPNRLLDGSTLHAVAVSDLETN
jgi:hypothetical protein